MLPDGARLVFFFNDTATTAIYTLSLHDALPISAGKEVLGQALQRCARGPQWLPRTASCPSRGNHWGDRKSTRLNSSHTVISYAVFCLKKKKQKRHSHLKANRRRVTSYQTRCRHH